MSPTDSIFVVTRPAPGHRPLMARLNDDGIRAIHCPGFSIESAPERELAERVAGLSSFDIVIVTSPVAARLVAERRGGTEFERPLFVAPGQGTASVLENAGLHCSVPKTGGTSEHILAMPDLAAVDGSRIAVVCAPGGRGLLASELSRRGAQVEAVPIYRRQAVPPAAGLIDALEEGLESVILISSLQTFDTITESLPRELRPGWLSSRFVVSSGRLEQACRSAGVARIARANGAADEQMLAGAVDAGWLG